MLMELKNELYLMCYKVLYISFLLKFMPKCYHQYAIRKDVFVLVEFVRRNKCLEDKMVAFPEADVIVLFSHPH